jgi:signal transduction histidine kinase
MCWRPGRGEASFRILLRLPSWRFPADHAHNEGMRAIIAAVAALGGGLLIAAFAVSAVQGDTSEAYWLVLGPLPFLAIGLAGYLRQPGRPVTWWLADTGAAFAGDVSIGDVFLPMAENHWGVTSPATATIALAHHWIAIAAPVAAVGLIGLFPSGRPERGYERAAVWTVALAGLLIPLLEAVTRADIAPAGGPPYSQAPVLFRALYVPALAPLGGAAEAVYRTNAAWPLVGIILLALRYRYAGAAQRRQIRWLLLGMGVSSCLWIPVAVLWQVADPDNASAATVSSTLSALLTVTILGPLLIALFYTGVFGIDEPARRALVHRVLRVSTGAAIALLAVAAGLVTSLAAPVAVAVTVAVAAGAAGQAVRRRLEHAADRWVLGARLAGYAGLSRFGESLTRVPGSDALLRDLAREIRRGLGLTWTRVTLEPESGPPRVAAEGTPAGEPAAAVPVEHRGAVLGRIECGPRSDGPLLPEDRRLLAYFAVQAAIGVHNLYLVAELGQQVDLIRDQASELAASRDRIVAGQDAERRRIQAVLHDGVQQEIVALSAKAGLIRQQLLRGDPAAAGGLADMQRELAATLQDVREIAYAIHPPVLSDRGLLEAIEAQSSRLALPMAVRADPGLRGVRFGEQIEATAWYVLSEALANVVKHAGASEVEVSLERQDDSLALVIRDDGCGFALDRPRGLGLTGLSDRLDTVGGSVIITSAAGSGTSVRVSIPVDPSPDRRERVEA